MVRKLRNQIVLFFTSIFFSCSAESNTYEQFTYNIYTKQYGFHRTLCYNSHIPHPFKISSVLIEEILPKDIYVDVYQVSEINAVSVKDLVDNEVPAYLASSQEVMLCTLSETGIHEICMPFHFRYQAPHSCKIHGESVIVEKDIPTITARKVANYTNAISFGCFKDKDVVFKLNESVVFSGIPSLPNLKFEIPVGCIEDFHSVLFLSTVVIPLSAIYLSLNVLKADKVFSKTVT